MGSIIYHLQSEEILRLRCGIRNPLQDEKVFHQVDFVLSPFDPGEHEVIREMIFHARDALTQWMNEGIEIAMNRWNPRMEE
jgi:PTH1 family peptidyl-tRNA hydrolase